jgi:hypothetical protein
VHDNGSTIKDYVEVFYNFLGIPITSAEQLAIILKNNKKVDFKKVQDSELINEYCEDLIADNMNFEVHITNI